MLSYKPELLLDATVNDQNYIQGTVNNILTLTENATQGVANQGTNIGNTLGIIISIVLFLVVLAMVLSLFPKVWKGLTSWVSAVKMPKG